MDGQKSVDNGKKANENVQALQRRHEHINDSIYVMRDKLIERKRQRDLYGRIGSVGMLIGSLPLIQLFFMEDLDLSALIGMFATPITWLGIVILFASFSFYRVYYERAKGKYDALREELMSKIWNFFCSHWEGCTCKEEFMQETKKKYNINLYYK